MKLSWLLPAYTFIALANAAPMPLTFISEQNPPVNYENEQQKAAGFSVELLKLIWRQLNEPQHPIKFLPWARAYYIAQTEPGSVLFATSRTADRENMFKWVCPISTAGVALFRRKKDNFDLTSTSAINDLTIGVIRADIAEDVVIAKTYNKSRLVKARNTEQLIRLLQSGKIDMIAAYEPVVYATIQQMGLSPVDYPKELVLQRMTDCFAFNRSTSDRVINNYQKALAKVRESMEYRTLVNHYHMLDFK
mgnify:FL=1